MNDIVEEEKMSTPTERDNIRDGGIMDNPRNRDQAVARTMPTANSAQADRITAEDIYSAYEHEREVRRSHAERVYSGEATAELTYSDILYNFLEGKFKLAKVMEMEELPIWDDECYDNLVIAVRDKVLLAFNLECYKQGITSIDQVSSNFQEEIVNELERTKQFMEQTRAERLNQIKTTVVNNVREKI